MSQLALPEMARLARGPASAADLEPCQAHLAHRRQPTVAPSCGRADAEGDGEGQRFRIDPTVDLDALALTPVGRIVARAVRAPTCS